MLGSYGYERPTSPRLDHLAESGVLFETAVSTSPWTLPAHASLFTGLYPSRHGVRSENSRLRDETELLAEILSRHGYLTLAIVNSYFLSERYGFGRGFDRYSYLSEVPARPEPSAIFDTAIEWLSATTRRPFFLFVHDYHVHSDYRSLPEFERMFRRSYTGDADGSTRQLSEFRRGERSLSLDDVDHLLDLYAAGIRQTDAEVAKLLLHLELSGELENTLIVVTSDHGEEFLEHGDVLHGRTQYDELMRVPLILAGPGVPRGRRVSTAVSIVDVLPTLLSLLNVSSEPRVDGIDVTYLWDDRDDTSVGKRFLFGEADHNNEQHDITRSVRYLYYKLIHNRMTESFALYNLVLDPREQTDVSGEQAAMTELLRSQLENFMEMETEGESLPEIDQDVKERLRELGYLR
jgi:arylsulfatase A-like enzyme